MIARYDTITSADPATFGALLRHGVGAFVIERFLWEPLAKLDRKDLLGEDEGTRAHALASRLGNCDEFFRILREGLGCGLATGTCEVQRVKANAPAQHAAPSWPYDEAHPSTIGWGTTLSVHCRIFLDARDKWSAGPVVMGATSSLPVGSMLVTHGSLPVAWAPNHNPDSLYSVDILLVVPWLKPPK